MNKFLSALACVGVAAMASGCAMAAAPVPGTIYSGLQAHSNATGNPAGPKRGESCAMSILGAIAVGDASATSAAANGGITKVSVVDTDVFSVLGVYAKYCTVVHGE